MEVRFTTDKKDMWNFNMYLTKTVPALRRNLIVNTIFVPVSIIVVGLIIKLYWLLTLIATLVFTGFYMIVVWSTLKKQVATLYTLRKDVLGERVVEISDRGVKEVTENGVSEKFWGQVDSVQSDKRYIYIFIGPHYAHIIPKAAFSSSDNAQNFLNTAKMYFEKSRN